jgi:hypothetical protein
VAAKRPKQQQLFGGSRAGAPVRRVRRGVDGTVTALRSTGRLEKADDALVAMARTLADALDDEHTATEPSRFTVGALAGKLLPVLMELRGEDSTVVADSLDELLARMPAALGNPPPT